MTQPERVKSIKFKMTEARARMDRGEDVGSAIAERTALRELAQFVAGDMSAATIYTAKRMAKEILK